MRRLIHAFKDNSLTIILLALFITCISAQTFAGWRLQNVKLAAHGQGLMVIGATLSPGTFLEAEADSIL